MDVKRILSNLNIEFNERGKNTRRGCVSIRCPMCGDDDPSEHMNLNLKSGYGQCWRNRNHAGSLRYVLTLIVGAAAANDAVQDDGPAPSAFIAAVAQLNRNEPSACLDGTTTITLAETKALKWPAEARKIRDSGPELKFWRYLTKERGFSQLETTDLCAAYNLRCCSYGDWNSRLLFPIYSWDDTMIAWTGRAVGPSNLRYKAWPPDNTIKTSVFGLPGARNGGKRLVLVEGPADCLRADWWAPKGIHAIALMGTSATSSQQRIIRKLMRDYDELCILLDADATQQALSLKSDLSILAPRLLYLPDQYKDPGEVESRTEMEAILCG